MGLLLWWRMNQMETGLVKMDNHHGSICNPDWAPGQNRGREWADLGGDGRPAPNTCAAPPWSGDWLGDSTRLEAHLLMTGPRSQLQSTET